MTMSTLFQEEYQALECEFRARVDADNAYHEAKSAYLPNLAPQGPVDFVLVAMEPSTGGGAGELKKGKAFSPKLGFTQFKRRRQGNLQVGGTVRPGVPECRGQRPTVRNLPTPATGGV